MKTLLNKISMIFKRYRTVSRRFNQNITTWTSVKSFLFSSLISLLIVALPLALVINMFIYTKLMIFLSVIILGLVISFIYLYYKFYFVLISNYHEKVKEINTKYIYWVETSIINIIILVIGVTILFSIF